MTAPTNDCWPESVPVLTADDFCRGRYHGPNGTHCLAGHALAIKGTGPVLWDILEAIRDEAGCRRVPAFNDNPRNSKAKLARVWNRAMRKLGYTEVEEVDA